MILFAPFRHRGLSNKGIYPGPPDRSFRARSPAGVNWYRCSRLLGLSGIVICIKPFFRSGLMNWVRNFVRSFRPMAVMSSTSVLS